MSERTFVYVGGYGPQFWDNQKIPKIDGKAKGVRVYELNGDTGKLTFSSEIVGIMSPGTLVVSPNQRFLYAANETRDFEGYPRGYGGGVTAFSIDQKTGELSKINDSLSYGTFSNYVNIDKTGKYLLVSNHGSYFYTAKYDWHGDYLVPRVIRDDGSVSLFKVEEDGSIGKVLDVQILEGTGYDAVEHASAHPHSVGIDEDDCVVVPNKGGDSVYLFRLNRDTEKLDMLYNCPASHGASPRHIAFLPGGSYLMVTDENNAHVTSYFIDKKLGTLQPVKDMTTVQDGGADTVNASGKRPRATDIQMHPDGRFIYANNSQGYVVCFEVDCESGQFWQRGAYPGMRSRGFQIDRTGKWLVTSNMFADKICCFSIKRDTGVLMLADSIEAPTPTAIRFAYL